MDEMMVEAYVSGVSQRKMGDVTEALLGERVGRSTVRLVAKRLDGAVEALRSAPIEGPLTPICIWTRRSSMRAGPGRSRT